MIALRQAELVVLRSLLQGHPEAVQTVGDLPAEAFADPEHQATYWRLLVGDPGVDASDLQHASEAGADDVAGACELIRSCWRAAAGVPVL